MSRARRKRPLFVFDGECRFCRKWVARWRDVTGDAVEFTPFQDGVPEEIKNPERAVAFIESDGRISRGAEAVLRLLAPWRGSARALLWICGHVPPVRFLAQFLYAVVATFRPAAAIVTTLIWGADVRRPSFGIGNAVFLRGLALTFLIALVSYWVQVPGLLGDRGILPVSVFFDAVRAQGISFAQFPSLVAFAPSTATLHILCGVGIIASLAALAGIAMPACFAVLWAVMLSLVVAGQDFYNFQWDALLIECGFVGILLAPWSLRPGWHAADPPRWARWVGVALLFRLMFSSGVVKIASGDPSWLSLDALSYHFFTQPLPGPLAWNAHQLPAVVLRLLCSGMFLIELVVPFFFFSPRRLRHAAALATIGLQVGIAVTGNYAFFNLLTAALCMLLLDDSFFRKRVREPGRTRFLPGKVVIPISAALLIVGLVPLAASFRQIPGPLRPLLSVWQSILPWRTVNNYGLFAMMTTKRREIVIQGSNDGVEWRNYVFRWKPGDPHRPLPVVAPHQPRLDWQMWFAALGTFEQNRWLQQTFVRLLQGSPEVIALFEANPFPEAPPRFLRALSDDFTFTGPDERARTGKVWHVEPAADYAPQMSLEY